LGGTITLPADLTHLKQIAVVAVNGSTSVPIVTFTTKQITGTSLPYSSTTYPQPAASQVWTVTFTCSDENGTPTLNPFSTTVTVNPAVISSVTAGEAPGARVSDDVGSTTTTINVTPVIANAQLPINVTVWLSLDGGTTWWWQGWWKETTVGQVIAINGQYVPVNGNETWEVACAPGTIDSPGTYEAIPTASLPSTAIFSAPFTVVTLGAPLTTDCTNASFLDYPGTNSTVNFLYTGGVWVWMWYAFDITLPTIAYDPTFWYCGFEVQKVDVNGNPAPDYEGQTGRQFTDSGEFTGGLSGQGLTITVASDAGTWWAYPPVNNIDGTPNIYRTFRFRAFAYSRATNPATGKPGLPTLQQCWPGGADHFDITISTQPAALDLSQVNPNTMSSSFVISDNGQFSVAEDGITSGMIASVNVTSLVGTIQASQIGTITAGQITGQINASQISTVNATSISGLVTATQIANVNAVSIIGQITASQISTITASQITGQISASQISAVNATSITGQIAASQISTVNATSIQGTILASQISTVSASSIQGYILASQIASVNAANISGSITATQISSVNATSISGVIVTGQLASGILNSLSLFSNQLLPMQTVTALPGLPNAAYPVGCTVSLTTGTSSVLYTNVNNSWNNQTAASSVTGQLTASQIGSVNTSSFVGLIAAGQIGGVYANTINGSIQTSQLAGGITANYISSVYATAISGSITSGQISSVSATSITGSITSSQIGSINATTITVNQIGPGQISGVYAGSILAGTITATISLNSPTINGGSLSISTSTGTVQINSSTLGVTVTATNSSASGFRTSFANYLSVIAPYFYSTTDGTYTCTVNPSYVGFQGPNINTTYGNTAAIIGYGSYASTLSYSALSVYNINCITYGTFVGTGVSCSSYGVNCYSLTAGYGGITVNGTLAINSSGAFVGNGVDCPYNGVAGSGFNVYQSGWYYGNTFTLYDYYGNPHQVRGGIITTS
jgi:hypothetical protein